MRKIDFIMGMPIIIDVPKSKKGNPIFKKVFDYFRYIDDNYSPFKKDSQVSKFNRGENINDEMKVILKLAEKTKKETDGYFNIEKDGKINPSGLVKGWAIKNAADILRRNKIDNFYLEAGGDIQVAGIWEIGIRNPFKKEEIVKVLKIKDRGIATSGNYEKGLHIYNPTDNNKPADEISAITVIGPNIYDADRFATAAFAMGAHGINFIEKLNDFEGYMIDKKGLATMTTNFNSYVKSN